jgi:hypothetical protein
MSACRIDEIRRLMAAIPQRAILNSRCPNYKIPPLRRCNSAATSLESPLGARKQD